MGLLRKANEDYELERTNQDHITTEVVIKHDGSVF